MKITLVLNEKSRDFFADITARKSREAYELKAKIVKTINENGGEYPEALLDEMTAFVVKAFDNQFDAQEYLDGYKGWFFDSMELINSIMNNVLEALAEGFPKKPKPQTEK